MGTGVIIFFTPLAAPPLNPYTACNSMNISNNSPKPQFSSASWCCFCTTNHSGLPLERRAQKEQPRYPRDEFYTHDYGGIDGKEYFGIKNSRKRRNWWPAESVSWILDAEEDEDDDYDEDSENGLRVFQGPFGFSPIFKVLIGFVWIVPAIIMLVGTESKWGTETHGFFMALVLPLAQSALSLILDVMRGGSAGRMRRKDKSRKMSFSKTVGNKEMKKRRKRQTAKSTNGYLSWIGTNDVETEKGEGKRGTFGGWDDLDR